ncbi:MAG: helix-turn-helix transcriptional regulator [Pseudomonadota bacterium]
MAIRVDLDVVLAQRRIKGKELAAAIGISEQNLSLLRTGKVKGVRFATLARICEVLECQPGDLLRYEEDASSSEVG